MKSFFAAITTLTALAGTALAAPVDPTSQTVTVSFANDQVGNNGAAQIALNGVPTAIPALYAATGLNKNGQFLATSAQLTSGIGLNPFCVITLDGQVVGNLNAQQTFTSFGPQPLDFAIGSIQCEV